MAVTWEERAMRLGKIQSKLCAIKQVWRKGCLHNNRESKLACKYSYATAEPEVVEAEYRAGEICKHCFDSLMLGPEYRRLVARKHVELRALRIKHERSER
jgi:hypothetical protein